MIQFPRIEQRLQALFKNQKALGFWPGLKWTLATSANHRNFAPPVLSVHPSWLQYPVNVRMGNSSDVDLFSGICAGNELSYWRANNFPTPKVIIDLGANVGYVSAAFLSLFPDAFVIAVDPDPINVEMCQRNLKPYGNRVKVVEGAVWHTPGDLVLSRGTFGDGREWATEVRLANPGETADVVAWDVPSLLKLCPGGQADLLKIDIEGSERSLFSRNTEAWLPFIRNISIEFHGPECQAVVLAALAEYTYETAVSGEYSLLLNLRQ